MRRPLVLIPIALCLSFTASIALTNFAHAGIIDDIRNERSVIGKHGRLSNRQQMQLERRQQLQEIEQQKREAHEARREERLKALAEARAAKAAERAEKLAAFEAAKTAKAAALAGKRAAEQTAKNEVRLVREAEKQAALAAIETEKHAQLEAEQAARDEKDEQMLEIANQHQDDTSGWIDTDEGTRPPPRQEVTIETREAPGTIIIDTSQRRLYYVLGDNRAIQYGIGVGRPGFEWMGVKSVTRKEEWPDWRPPDEMVMRRPDLPRFMPGGPTNPLGARAMYLGSTLYRIHGSNEPETIGQAVSSGCFRMVNADVIDLFNRTQLGAKVIVR
jgi:lipoprotein-anchoring transpeptidase ErfK/SrfK